MAAAMPFRRAPSRSPSALLVHRLFRRKVVLAGAVILVIVASWPAVGSTSSDDSTCQMSGTSSTRYPSLFPPGIPIGRVSKVDAQEVAKAAIVRASRDLDRTASLYARRDRHLA